MRTSRRLAVLGLAMLSLYLLRVNGGLRWLRESVERGRMKNVVLLEDDWVPPAPSPEGPAATPTPTAEPEPVHIPEADAGEEIPVEVMESPRSGDVRETTIPGGLSIKNATGYSVDTGGLLLEGPPLRLPAEGPQILILHTHGSEAYTQAGLDRYEANDSYRTEDTSCNIVRVGDELTTLFEKAGLRVLHDREIYDYPSYTGSYNRSGEAIARYLQEYPGIAVVLDIHRDALGADGVIYKTMAEEEGTVSSQIMLLVGTDASGLEHPNWRSNLALALYLQEAAGRKHPTLMRPVELVAQRYNQHLTTGSLILEVGSSGNTLQEALAAIRLFADGAAPALLALAESGAEETSNS
ncbi:MAG: stage II sporulation protein P [Eubacteriales bacterium]|nr:stage II sporulation protein P [Eubacteriales bacterium]